MSTDDRMALEYRIYRESDVGPVTELLADVFSRRDPLALAAQVSSADFAGFVRSLLPRAAEDGLTVVACQAGSGEIVGVLLTNDAGAAPPEEMAEINAKFAPIASILGDLDGIYLAGRVPRPGEMLHLYLLGVSDRVKGRGVGQELVRQTVKNGERKGYRIAFAEATNKTSQHIFRKLGFAERAQLLYADYVFDGQRFFARYAEHGGPILVEKVLGGA